jgi:hypothetical protein
MSPLLSRLGSSNFGFNKKKGGRSSPEEYVLFGGTSGTILVPSSITSIKIAGSGGGANGNTAPGSPDWNSGYGGGGGASNIVGNSFPVSGVTALYYSVGNSGEDTFIKANSSGGTDIIRLVGSSGQTGAPATGGGPNAVAGGNGGAEVARYSNGSSGLASPSPGGCGGGGGGGSITNNGEPGTAGGAGGAFTANPNALIKLGSGPAPNTWSFGTTPVSTVITPLGSGSQGQSFSYAFGGRSFANSGSAGSGRGGGAGVGLLYSDPSSPENGQYFGGGGGGDGTAYGGAFPSVNARQGGKGILVIQLLL